MCYYSSVTTRKFQSISLYGQKFLRFWVTGHFETITLDDSKITLNPTRSNVPHICVPSIHESQILLRFVLRPAFFEIQAILRHMQQMTPKWPWTLQGQWCCIYVVTSPPPPPVPNFSSVCSTSSPFQDIAHFIIPHWLPRYRAKQKEQKLPKIQTFKFHNYFNNLVETLRGTIHGFWEANMVYTLRGDVWNFYSHMVPC